MMENPVSLAIFPITGILTIRAVSSVKPGFSTISNKENVPSVLKPILRPRMENVTLVLKAQSTMPKATPVDRALTNALITKFGTTKTNSASAQDRLPSTLDQSALHATFQTTGPIQSSSVFLVQLVRSTTTRTENVAVVRLRNQSSSVTSVGLVRMVLFTIWILIPVLKGKSVMMDFCTVARKESAFARETLLSKMLLETV